MEAKNNNHVPKRQWRKWSERARLVFNEVYSQLLRGRESLNAPDAVSTMKPRWWRTVSWNAAWVAADASDMYA